MKKLLRALILCIFAVFAVPLCACGNGNGGTYYPNSGDMKINLETGGYTVVVTTDLGGKSGTYLCATKDNEYIDFYWLDNAEDCQYFYNLLKEKHTENNSLVQIENDEKFGNIVYCGTEHAVNTAGIRVVTVKV